MLIGTTSGWPRQTAGLTVMANVLPWCAHEGDLASPIPVIAETSWLLLDRLGHSSHLGFLRMVTAGRLRALDLEDEEWRRCSELVERYQDLRLDLMDVSVVFSPRPSGWARTRPLPWTAATSPSYARAT